MDVASSQRATCTSRHARQRSGRGHAFHPFQVIPRCRGLGLIRATEFELRQEEIFMSRSGAVDRTSRVTGWWVFAAMLLGIAGATVASLLGQALHLYHPGQPAGFLGSILGAMLTLFIYRTVFRRGTV